MNPEVLILFYNHSFIDIIISIILLFLSVAMTLYMRNILQLDKNLTTFIFSMHSLMFPIYMLFLFYYGTDSLTYFIGYEGYFFNDLETGNIFMNKFLDFFHKFKLNFYNVNYFFSILSLISILLYLKLIQNIKFENKKNFYFVAIFFLLPSIHFWHMGYSKDTLTFFFISLIVYEVLKSRPKLLILIFSLTMLYFIRVHICLIALLSLSAYLLLISKLDFKLKILCCLILINLIPFLLKAIFNFTDLESIFTFLNKFRDLYIQKDSTAIYSDTNFLLKIFYYNFLPNIFIMKDLNLFYIFISIENTILLILFLKVFNLKFIKYENFKNIYFLVFFSFLAMFLLTYVTSNLGISSRQKWIFLPSLYILFSTSKFNLNKK